MQICINPEIGVIEIFGMRNLGFLLNDLGTILLNSFKMPLMYLDYGNAVHTRKKAKVYCKREKREERSENDCLSVNHPKNAIVTKNI